MSNPQRRIPTKAQIDEAFRTLEMLKSYFDSVHGGSDQAQTQQSYVQIAIAALAEIGRPTPITVLLERIRERRNDPTITRGSAETSLLRHLNSKGEKAEMVKPSPGTYALRQHVAA